jgi:hypothetical protein
LARTIRTTLSELQLQRRRIISAPARLWRYLTASRNGFAFAFVPLKPPKRK